MTQDRDFFIPASVDEQVEQFSSRQPGEPARLASDKAPAQAETRRVGKVAPNRDGQDTAACLVRELQAFYQADYEQNQAFLARARRRIVAHQLAPHTMNPPDSAPVLHFSQERTRKMQPPHSMEPSTGRRLSRTLSLLAAVLVVGLLVGTLAVVLTLSHNQQAGTQVAGRKASATNVFAPKPASIGTVLYKRQSPAGTDFNGAAWSPDGKRIAVPDTDQTTGKTTLSIWDAASGKSLKTFPLNVADLGDVQWSPTGKYLVMDNLQVIVVVDSQTGAIVNTIKYQAPTAFNVSGTDQSLLASTTPLGGGFGFYSVAWSPDGKSLGVAISNITSGKVVLLDPLTGAIKTTFSAQAAPIGLALAFSSDGKYLAVSFPNVSEIVVWSVATQQVVFVLGNAQSMSIGWQPGTHNLARNTSTSVELWDINVQKLLKTYQGFSAFAWSPDGKELAAYTSFFAYPFSRPKNSKVTILKASTGVRVGSYTSQSQMILSISWSPDGRSIASHESSMNSNNQIVVWVA